MSIVNTDAPLTINTKINSSLSIHIDFLDSLFSPYCIEWPGAVLLVEMLECIKAWSKSCPFTLIRSSFLLNSHVESFFKCKALKKTAVSFRLLYALPGPCGLSISHLMSSSCLVYTKNSCDFQSEIHDC